MEAAVQFKPGDVVRLKSSGPNMTVSSVRKESGELFCVWFGKESVEDPKSHYFKPETLEKVR